MHWIHYTAANQYASANHFDFNYQSNVSFNTSTAAITDYGFRPCTFVFDGVTYGGIEFYISEQEQRRVEFVGSSNFSLFGLDYYNMNTKTILNQEVYDSLNYTNYTLTKQDTYRTS